MLNEIMDAVTQKLDELFPDYRIYIDEVEQGLELPCFFVSFLEPSKKNMLGPRSYRSNNMCIQFLSEEGQSSRQRNKVADVLLDNMEFIKVQDGQMIHGTNMSVNEDRESQLLNFFISYNLFTVREDPKDCMQELELERRIKSVSKEIR